MMNTPMMSGFGQGAGTAQNVMLAGGSTPGTAPGGNMMLAGTAPLGAQPGGPAPSMGASTTAGGGSAAPPGPGNPPANPGGGPAAPNWKLFCHDEAFSPGQRLSSGTRVEDYRSKIKNQSRDNVVRPHGLLAMQLLLTFSNSVRHFYVIATLLSTLAKCVIFPETEAARRQRLGEELPCLIFFALLEGWRLDFGFDGNTTERCNRLALFNLFSIPQICFLGFFFTAQVYVFRVDSYLALSLLLVTALQVFLTLPLAARIGGGLSMLNQVGGQLEVWLSAGGCAFFLFVVFVLFDQGQTESSGQVCPNTGTADCTTYTAG